jgi:hypothetical protein
LLHLVERQIFAIACWDFPAVLKYRILSISRYEAETDMSDATVLSKPVLHFSYW